MMTFFQNLDEHHEKITVVIALMIINLFLALVFLQMAPSQGQTGASLGKNQQNNVPSELVIQNTGNQPYSVLATDSNFPVQAGEKLESGVQYTVSKPYNEAFTVFGNALTKGGWKVIVVNGSAEKKITLRLFKASPEQISTMLVYIDGSASGSTVFTILPVTGVSTDTKPAKATGTVQLQAK